MQFANDYYKEFNNHFPANNTFVILSVANLEELEKLSKQATELNFKHSRFIEPDIGNELTAITFFPRPEIKKLCSKLKLAGK